MRIANRWIGSIGIGLLCVGFLVGYFTGESIESQNTAKKIESHRQRGDVYYERYMEMCMQQMRTMGEPVCDYCP